MASSDYRVVTMCCTRTFLESESDRDFVASLQELRLHFSGFITNLVNSYPRGNLLLSGH